LYADNKFDWINQFHVISLTQKSIVQVGQAVVEFIAVNLILFETQQSLHAAWSRLYEVFHIIDVDLTWKVFVIILI